MGGEKERWVAVGWEALLYFVTWLSLLSVPSQSRVTLREASRREG